MVSFNYALLKYYTDPHESVKVTLMIQVFAFSSVMVYILLIPFDVFASVRHFETVFSVYNPIAQHRHHLRIYDLYFICYVCMILLCFVGLPFSYFYAQSVQDSEEIDASDITHGGESTSLGMKGMDSSESSSEEEEQQDVEIDLMQD